MPTLQELRRFAATPMGRYEARASWRQSRRATYAAAGLIDILAALALVLALIPQPPDSGALPSLEGLAQGVAYTSLAVLVLAPMLWSISLSASAIAGERETGTLEALLLTPMDRRTLLWAKLLGRTDPPRRFMLATAPAYLCCLAVIWLSLLTFGGTGNSAWQRSWLTTVVCLLLAALATVLLWGILFYQMHATAAAGLWFSSKYQRTWTASLVTYAAILGPTVLLFGCGGIISLAWPMALGPALFGELVGKFDRRALGSGDQL